MFHIMRAVDVKGILTREMQVMEGKDVLTTNIDEVRDAIQTSLTAVIGLDALPPLRNIVVQYRGIELELPVHSISEEIDLRIAAYMKTRAVETRKLVALFMEDVLVAPGRVPEGGDIGEDVYRCFEIARVTAADMLSDETWSHGECVKNFLAQ